MIATVLAVANLLFVTAYMKGPIDSGHGWVLASHLTSIGVVAACLMGI